MAEFIDAALEAQLKESQAQANAATAKHQILEQIRQNLETAASLNAQNAQLIIRIEQEIAKQKAAKS